MFKFPFLSCLLSPHTGHLILQFQQLYFFSLEFVSSLFKDLRAIIPSLNGLLEVIVKNLDLLCEFCTLPGSGVVGGLQLIDLRIVFGISVPHNLVFINECPLLVGEVSVEILLPHEVAPQASVLNALSVVGVLYPALLLR
jgi:hypothetical protein